MPAQDGTGPWGAGPRTGGGRGWWAVPAGAVPVGAGLGRGWRGRGFRCGWGPWGGVRAGWAWRAAGPLSRDEELRRLKGYTAHLEQALEQARKSMAALEQEHDR